MTRVAINGAAGRMGRNLVRACLEDPALELAAAFEHGAHPALGRDAGELAGQDPAGVALGADLSAANFEVIVDFTRPEVTLELLEFCCAEGVAVVIGTTGFDDAQKGGLDTAAREIPIVFAPNMGVGVNLMFDLVASAARTLGGDYDIEVVEAHHRHKLDAPSGTALRLGEVAAAARGERLEDRAVYARQGRTGERETGTIGFATVRGGDIVGEHTVLFAGDGERIEITHRASSRRLFARGAMRAAAWIAGRPAGLYGMHDVLGLNPKQ
ncbi:MAG: 4-hydroxy-tetrahydrodipicolinate reductase [Halofilum sp. (in: g-proteobacteria)]|nr:4-hydroxy-tetrahydrodipicolinate reductase [Halofilum sp. (in: g-proteobacteria)]